MERRPGPDELLESITLAYEIARSLKPLEEIQERITLDTERRAVWLKQLQNVAHTTPPEYTVGVAGGTGAGKSTLLCALLGSSCLPTSSSRSALFEKDDKSLIGSFLRASTAAVTKISYHEHQFLRAEVHFLTEAEWLEDISIAQQDIMSENEKDVDKDAVNISLAKLQAVYPGVTKTQLLVANPDDLIKDLGDVLQKPMIIEDIESRQFVKKLEAFVATTGKRKERQFWPLVSYTQIFINSEILKPGMTLVDLPGSGDSNAARNKIAKNYLKNVDALWIVGRIQRILNDQPTNDWIEMMAGKFFADGRSGNSAVTFIATHVDEAPLYPEYLDVEQSEKLYSLDKLYKGASEKLKIAASELKRVRSIERHAGAKSRKRKLHERQSSSANVKKRRGAGHASPQRDTVSDSSEMLIKTEESDSLEVSALVGGVPCSSTRSTSKKNDLKCKVRKLKSLLNNIDREQTMLLTYARNEFIETHIRSDFKRRVLANASETDKYEGNLNIPVICVASKAFLALNNSVNGTSNALGAFRSQRETGIPLLRSHAIRYTLKFRKEPALLLLREARALAQEISLYLHQRAVPTTSSNRQFLAGVNEKLGVLPMNLGLIVSNSRNQFEDQISNFRTQLASGIDAAAAKAPGIIQELAHCCHYWNTYRAIMRDTGERGNFDFNGALSKPIVNRVRFRSLFTGSLPQVLLQLHQELLDYVEDMLSRITVTAGSSISEEVLKAVAGARVHHLTDASKDKSTKIVKKFQRNLVHSFSVRLRGKLASHYKEVGQEAGPGMLARMKSANIAYITEKRDEIFSSLNVDVNKSLDMLIIDTFAVVYKTTVHDIAAKVTRAFEALSTTLPSFPDSEIQHRKELQIFLENMLENSENVEASLKPSERSSMSSGTEDTCEDTEDSEDEDDSEDDSEESMNEGFEESEDTEEIEFMLTQ